MFSMEKKIFLNFLDYFVTKPVETILICKGNYLTTFKASRYAAD